jgi:tetratricopeptide (TPR) repeat protein
MYNIERITVFPFEADDSILQESVSDEIVRVLTGNIKKSKNYVFVDSNFLSGVADVDAYITGRVINIATEDKHETREIKSDEKTKVEITSTYTVRIIFEYSYTRTSDQEVLATIRKEGERTETDTKTITGLLSAVGVALSEPAVIKIARKIVRSELHDMMREIEPWTSTEERYIEKSKNNYAEERVAKKYVKEKKYAEALTIYAELYKRTGSVTAAYNTAVLLETQGKYNESLELLESVKKQLENRGMEIPYFIEREIPYLQKMIIESQGPEHFDENQEY